MLVFGLLLLVANNHVYVGYIGDLRLLEFRWTVFPAVILFCIAVPSIWLLYTYDVEGSEVLTIKVVGRQ